MIRHWEILNRKTLHDFKIMQIEAKKVRSPRTGNTADVLAIHFPAWVVVLAITAAKEVVMVRQYRHGTEKIHLELPGGLMDPDDPSPVAVARRELLEETGYGSKDFHIIGECFPQPAIFSNKCFVCLAIDTEYKQDQTLDEGEDIEVVKIPITDIPLKIDSNDIDNGMTLLAFFYFWTYEKKEKRLF
jgi:8-oxo-dGTP pyrophosphatase MutT (NUDIX family)